MTKIIFDGQPVDERYYFYPQRSSEEIVNNTQPIGISDGENLVYSRTGERIISVQYHVYEEKLRNVERFLAKTFVLKRQATLIFSDEPDEVWDVVVNDKPTIVKNGAGISGVIEFLVPSGVSHSVATQTADNLPYKDVPMNNLFTDTRGFDNPDVWADWEKWNKTGEKFNGLIVMETNSSWGRLGQPIRVVKGEVYTFSVYARYRSGTGISDVFTIPDGSTARLSQQIFEFSLNETWQRISATFTVLADGVIDTSLARTDNNTNTLLIAGPKLEIGNAPTDWSPNPADPEYYSDTIAVDYQGNYPAYPILTATMKSENGLVAFVNDKGGVLQFGSPEEVDTVTKQKSDKVIDYGMRPGQTGFTQNVGPGTYTTYVGNKLPNKMQGSVTFVGETANPTYTSDTGAYWHGPSLHGAIPANSNGDNTGAFIWRNRFNFNTDIASLGHLEFTLTSGDKPVLMYTMRDSLGSANQIVSQFWGSGLDKSVKMNPKLFGNGFYEIAISRDNNGGLFTLSKVKSLNGESVVPGSTYKFQFNDSTFQTMPIDGMTCWFQKFSNKKATSMNWSDSKFSWVNVPYIEDVPNRFDTGDVVTVDTASRKVYLNGVVDNTLQAVGNQWDMFKLEPGINTIKLVGSSWATQFDTQLAYKEAWL